MNTRNSSLLAFIVVVGVFALFFMRQLSNLKDGSMLTHSRNNISILAEKNQHLMMETESEKHDRIAVIAFMGEHEKEARVFLTMMFGSWKFISDRKRELLNTELYRNSNIIDIVIFCKPSACENIKSVCTVVEGLHMITSNTDTPKCWAVHQTLKIDINYMPLNSYIMCMRPDIELMTKHYQYILRSDYDVFLTPGLFLFKTKEKLVFGEGGYSGDFPNNRLKEISKKLGLRHQGLHSVGSTWYGESAFFIQAGKLAYNMTRYMFLNEFKPELPGLEGVFKKNIEGEWPKWWRPVSSMYGGEIAVNHMIQNISNNNRQPFDTPSCHTKKMWTAVHIHCWQSDCEFQKFRFTKYVNMIINAQGGLPGPILHLLVENMYAKDINNMTVREYATHIAWYSVGRYLKKWIVKNEAIPEKFSHDNH